MKVKDLIRKLQQADQELEIFASPAVFLPSMILNSNTGELSGQSVMRTSNPNVKFSIINVGLLQSTYGEDDGQRYIILTYDEDEPLPLAEPEEFVN